jgi:hypothetical protein
MLARLIDYSLGFPTRCTEPVEVQLPPTLATRLLSRLASGLDRPLGLLAGDY